MNVHFIKSSEKRKILAELEEIYGISELPYLLIETGKKKLRAFSGHLSKEEIMKISELTKIEVIGMYFINKKDDAARLNFDAVSLLRGNINKNVIEIGKEQFDFWVRGHDLEMKSQKGVVILKYGDDLVGVGKSNGEKIFNYVPKERKLRR